MKVRRFLLFLIVLGVPFVASGKRVAAPFVLPLVLNGVEYSAHGDGTHGWVTATDIATKKELWTANVFHIHTHWWKGEEDNQWIYISGFKFESNMLFIKDERSHYYRLNLNTRRVERVHSW